MASDVLCGCIHIFVFAVSIAGFSSTAEHVPADIFWKFTAETQRQTRQRKSNFCKIKTEHQSKRQVQSILPNGKE